MPKEGNRKKETSGPDNVWLGVRVEGIARTGGQNVRNSMEKETQKGKAIDTQTDKVKRGKRGE